MKLNVSCVNCAREADVGGCHLAKHLHHVTGRFSFTRYNICEQISLVGHSEEPDLSHLF